MPVKRNSSAAAAMDMPVEIPPQTAEIDAYISGLKDKLAWVEEQQSRGVRTTDYTITNFSETKRDRLWKMKVAKEMIDTVLVTADGHRESVHMDVIVELNGAMEAFFGEQAVASSENNSSSSKHVKEYKVKADISAAVLAKVVTFAYLWSCELAEEGEEEPASLLIALSQTAAKYRMSRLLAYCIEQLVKHCSPPIAFFAYQLTQQLEQCSNNKAAQGFFQQYIEEHFEELYSSPPQKEDLLRLSFPLLSSVLRWNKLNVRSEETIWQVISDWVNFQPATRLPLLPALLTGCLRLGRLSPAFLEQTVLGGALFAAQDERSRARCRAAVKAVLEPAGLQANGALIFKDGHGLPYSKAVTAFRPRATRQLLVVAGGWVDGKTTQLIEVLDHQSNLWLSVPLRLSHAVSYFGFELLGTVLYIFGGSNGREIYRSVVACDIGGKALAATRVAGSSARIGQWEPRASMNERRCYVSSAVLGGLIYAIGGFNQTERVKKCERFDPAANEWTAIAELNYARSDASCVAHGGRLYVAGGINDSNIERSVEVYCPQGNTWTLVKSMATPRTSFGLASFGGRIWALGGNDGEQRLNSCESYDPQLNDAWRAEPPLVTVRSTFQAVAFMGELYAVGGYNGQSPISTVEKYVPELGRWVKARHLRHDRSGMALLVLPNAFPCLKI